MNAAIEIRNPTLNRRKTALEAKLAELTGVFQDRSELAVENAADLVDVIQMTAGRDLLAQRMNISARTLSAVRLALDNLATGNYGICEECEEPISSRRLDAVPWARLCLKCQEARDSQTGEEGNEFPLAA
ncbi:MAG TPA: TraR/DksA family transcriptional regulator [Bryobacteraceae bacterium]|jgi:DnaK suppressor protein